MSATPQKKSKRRATIFVTGPQTKKTIFDGEEDQNEPKNENKATLQDLAIARQRLHNELAVVNTASGIEILMQIFMDEMEILRFKIRENGEKMRGFFRGSAHKIRDLLLRIFRRNLNLNSRRGLVEDLRRNEENLILNQMQKNGKNKETEIYKIPRFTLNDIEEILTGDDLEDGVIQKRSEKWACLPERHHIGNFEADFSDLYGKLNVPMEMFDEEEEMDRFSMPSTRTTRTEDQMAQIQNQLAMLSKQLMSLQKGSSRASSRRGGRALEKKSSIEMPSSSPSSSDISEDEGKGPSVCSPSLSSSIYRRKSSSSDPPKIVAPISQAPPPPPPPPPADFKIAAEKSAKTPLKKSEKSNLPPPETIVSKRPYLTDIANGRSLLKKTIRSPGGSPGSPAVRPKRAVSSFEAALRDRFRGFHGDETSFSEQEENGDDDDVNATWDE